MRINPRPPPFMADATGHRGSVASTSVASADADDDERRRSVSTRHAPLHLPRANPSLPPAAAMIMSDEARDRGARGKLDLTKSCLDDARDLLVGDVRHLVADLYDVIEAQQRQLKWYQDHCEALEQEVAAFKQGEAASTKARSNAGAASARSQTIR